MAGVCCDEFEKKKKTLDFESLNLVGRELCLFPRQLKDKTKPFFFLFSLNTHN
jgi:hypothetical protein